MKGKKFLLVLIPVAIMYILIPASFFLFVGAMNQRTYEYSFSQPLNQVEKVEIRKYDYDTSTATPFVVLDERQANALLTDIDALSCKRYFGHGSTSYGEAVVYITYANGEAEVIGIYNVAKVDTSGKWHMGLLYFPRKELCTLLLQYAPELLPELQKYLE